MSDSEFKIIDQHIKNLHSNIRGGDGELLFNFNVNKRHTKKKDLTVHFVTKLLEKLQIDEGTIMKCMKAPMASLAKVLELTHLIVIKKAPITRLAEIKRCFCDELRVIPQRLSNPAVLNDVKEYIERHVK
jgi:hypothetical protein